MALLAIFLPFLSSLFCLMYGYKIGRLGVTHVSIFTITLTAFLSFILFYIVGLNHQIIVISIFSWFSTEFFNLEWTFLLDSLSVTMLLVVSLVSMIVHFYSISYMAQDPQLPRFLSYLSLFTFFMFILITASNFLQLFMGWEGVGLCSYLLISFWYTRISAGKSALQAIVLNRIGDCGLLLAIFAIFLVFRSLDFAVVFSLVPFESHQTFVFFNQSYYILPFITFFLLIAAIGKSAQLGLHTWLPSAMEGPTPVSALIHAATMVTAGVFLVIRCSSLFEWTPSVLIIMAICGSCTSIFAASVAIVQHDIKKVIAYSTCSQLGYMIFCCGLSNYTVSFYHLVNHAFFKALLFLSAGAVIHALSNEQDIRRMGGLAKILPFTFTMMLLGSLALCGFPFLSGFYSKDLILETTLHTSFFFQYFIIYTSFLTALLTSVYSFRLLYLVFIAKPSFYRNIQIAIHEVDKTTAFSLSLLAVGSLFSGYFFFDIFAGIGSDFFETAIFQSNNSAAVAVAVEFLNPFFKQIAPTFGLLGIGIAYFLLTKKNIKLTIFKMETNYFFYKFLINKWYFDNLFAVYAKKLIIWNYTNCYKLLDKGIFEFFGPRGSVLLVYYLSDKMSKSQSGYIWHYMCVMILFLLIVMYFLFYIS